MIIRHTCISLQDDNNALMLAIKTGDSKVVNTLWPHRSQVDINHRNTVRQEMAPPPQHAHAYK